MDRQKLGTFVLGGLAGAVAGILAAPRSGRETRGSILDRVSETRERGRESYFEAREKARERSQDERLRGASRLSRGRSSEATLGEDAAEVPSKEAPQESPATEANGPYDAGIRAVTPGESEVSTEQGEELRRRVERTRQRLRDRGAPGDGS